MKDRVSITIDKDVRKAVKAVAQKEHRAFSSMVELILRKFLEMK